MSDKKISELTCEELDELLKSRKKEEAENKKRKKEAYEAIENEVVLEIANEIIALSELLTNIKQRISNTLNAHYDLLKDYSGRGQSDDKGNFTLFSKDDKFKVLYKNQSLFRFDARSQEAENLILEFVNESITDTFNKEVIKELLQKENGHFDIKLVQKLYKMRDKHDHPKWVRGLDLLMESWQATDSKAYIQVYKKNEEGKFESINTALSNA